MDARDLRILRAFGLLPFADAPRAPEFWRPAALARRAGVSPRLVRERLRRLERDGVVAGYEAYPNLRHFPLVWKTFHFRLPGVPKARLVRDLAPLDGFVGHMSFLGPDLCVDLYYRDEAEMRRRLKLVGALAGGASPIEWYDNRMPAPRRPLGALDWRVLRAMRGRALASPRELARDLGLSAKTVQRHRDRMLCDASLDIVPVLDPSAMEGLVPFALLFRLEPGARGAPAALRRLFEERILWTFVPPTDELAHLVLFLVASSTAAIEADRDGASDVRGVASVEAVVPTSAHESGEWLNEAIERKLAESRNDAVAAVPGPASARAVPERRGARRQPQVRPRASSSPWLP